MVYFLIYLYSENFSNDLRRNGYSIQQQIKIKQFLKEGIQQLMPCIFDNIEYFGHIDILKKCTVLFNSYENFRPLCERIVDIYTIPNKFNKRMKAEVYCFGLGYFFSNVKDYPDSFKKAIQSYDKALEIDPNRSDIWYNKAIDLSNLGKYEEAIKSFDKSIELDPNHSDVWYNRGTALNNLGKYEEAIKSFDRSIEIDPNHSMAWNNKGFSLSKLNRDTEAIESFDRAIEIDPNQQHAYYNKSISLRKLGRLGEGLMYYDAYDLARRIIRDQLRRTNKSQ